MLLLSHVMQLSAERQKAEHAAEQSELQSRLSEVQREAAVARAMTEGWQRDSKVRIHAQQSTKPHLQEFLSAVLWYSAGSKCPAKCARTCAQCCVCSSIRRDAMCRAVGLARQSAAAGSRLCRRQASASQPNRRS
jgi:hypothetical protein